MKISEKIDVLREETFAMFPDAVTELNYENPFQLLIAILMSAQTTDIQVNKANKEFFQVLKTPEDGISL
jgi:endonuclease-3